MYRRFRSRESLPSGVELLFRAVEYGDVEGVRQSLATLPPEHSLCYNEGDLAIHVAATRGHTDSVACDDDALGDPDLDSTSPAAAAGEPLVEQPCGGCLVIRLLAAHEPKCLRSGSGSGFKALHVAVQRGPLCAIRALIAAGADVLAQKEYHAHGGGPARSETFATPLHIAAREARVEAAHIMLASAPEAVHTVDRRGWTPLHYVAHFGRGRAATLTAVALMAAGASPVAAARDNTTPQALAAGRAEVSHDQELIELRQALDGVIGGPLADRLS